LSATGTLAQPVELKAVSFLPKDHRLCTMISKWIEAVNAQLKDEVKVNWIGGPEVMPPFEQPEAVKKGIFQIGFLPAAYYGGMLPAADAISLSKYDFAKEREKGGFFDYWGTEVTEILLLYVTFLAAAQVFRDDSHITRRREGEGDRISGLCQSLLHPRKSITALANVSGIWSTIGTMPPSISAVRLPLIASDRGFIRG
jgi:hypothetical protein